MDLPVFTPGIQNTVLPSLLNRSGVSQIFGWLEVSLPTPENFHKSPEISPSFPLFLNSPEKNIFSSFCIKRDNFLVRSAFYKRYTSLHGLNITVLVSCIVSDMLFLWANVDTRCLEAQNLKVAATWRTP